MSAPSMDWRNVDSQYVNIIDSTKGKSKGAVGPRGRRELEENVEQVNIFVVKGT